MGNSSEKYNAGKILQTTAKIGAVGLAAGLLGGAGVTLRDHRQLTHRSVELSKGLSWVIDAEHADHGVWDSTVWASVHRTHHYFPDATIFPFYKIWRAIDWVEKNPEKAKDVRIPDSFKNLDPFVERFSLDDVRKIGRQATEVVRNRLGEAYEEPKGYSALELDTILNPAAPQYYYSGEKKPKGEAYTQDDIAKVLLGDPHSPVRIPPPEENGVRGVAVRNVGLYSKHAKLYSDRPGLKPEDLRHKDGKNKDPRPLAILGGILVPAVAVLLKRGKFAPKDFAKAGGVGASIWATKVGFEIVGGNITNSYGHAGILTDSKVAEAFGRSKYQPSLNSDGSLTTDTNHSGVLGTILSRMTLDEVGGQKEHHDDPGKIAYTSKSGRDAFKEAPFGFMVSKLAESRWFPFIKPGKGFDLKEGETRPDVLHPAMEIIHKRRVEQNLTNATELR